MPRPGTNKPRCRAADGTICYFDSSNHCLRWGARDDGARQPHQSNGLGGGAQHFRQSRGRKAPVTARCFVWGLWSQSVVRSLSDPHTASLGNGRNRCSARCSFSSEIVVVIFPIRPM